MVNGIAVFVVFLTILSGVSCGGHCGNVPDAYIESGTFNFLEVDQNISESFPYSGYKLVSLKVDRSAKTVEITIDTSTGPVTEVWSIVGTEK